MIEPDDQDRRLLEIQEMLGWHGGDGVAHMVADDPNRPAQEALLFALHSGDVTIGVRFGWGPSGLHLDLTALNHESGEPVPITVLPSLDSNTLSVLSG